MPVSITPGGRLDGLDIARFLALIGMVIVNFSIVMGTEEVKTGAWGWLATTLHGRAAALFVVLAGVGLGLMAKRRVGQNKRQEFYVIQYKRALFLLVIGLFNMIVFSADILHYYAFYFAIGIVCIRWPTPALIATIGGLIVGFVALVLSLDYDAGWDWEALEYAGFWTVRGFIRNLFFNGWHPVVPWLGFLLWGILISRLDLYAQKTRLWLLASHGMIFTLASGLSYWLVGVVGAYDAEAALLFSAEPVPPMPLYVLAGAGAAGMAIALCLMIAPYLQKLGILAWFTRPGRQTLTLYVAHIYIGMGTLEAFGLLAIPGESQSTEMVMFASLVFCLAAMIYTWAWSKAFKRGPLESLMRTLTR